jgi:hypothetical protein
MERTKTIADFNTYKAGSPHAKLTRSPEGVLEVVLHHTDLQWLHP